MPPIATFKHPWLVRFVDTDASGFAHFSSYVKMMEETEYAFLRSRGLSVVLHDQRGILGFPRLSASMKINQPLRFGQQVEVSLSLFKIDGKQIVYDFEILTDVQIAAITGTFVVAFCRFPVSEPPYAVLIPAEVQEALTAVK